MKMLRFKHVKLRIKEKWKQTTCESSTTNMQNMFKRKEGCFCKYKIIPSKENGDSLENNWRGHTLLNIWPWDLRIEILLISVLTNFL